MGNLVELQIKATGAPAAKEALRQVRTEVEGTARAATSGQAAASSALESTAAKLKSWGLVASDAEEKGRQFVTGVARFAGLGGYAEQINTMTYKFTALTGAITTATAVGAGFAAGWKIGTIIDDLTGLSTALGNLGSGPALGKYDRAAQIQMERKAFEYNYKNNSQNKIQPPAGWKGSAADFQELVSSQQGPNAGMDAAWQKTLSQINQRLDWQEKQSEVLRLAKDKSAQDIVLERLAKGQASLPKDNDQAAAKFKDLVTAQQELMNAEKADIPFDNQVKLWEQYQDQKAKAGEDAADRLKKATLDEYDFQQYELDQWLEKTLTTYGASTNALDAWSAESAKIDQARTASQSAEIDKRLAAEFAEIDGYGKVLAKERDQARAHAAAMEELDRKMQQPTAGRFASRQADVSSEYLSRSDAISSRADRGDLSGAQAEEEMAKLQQWKDYEFNRIGLESSNNFSAGWADGMRKWQDDVQSGFENARQLAADTANAMSSTFSNVFFDAFTGNLKSAGEYFRSFCTDILRSISQMMAQQVTKQFISSIMGGGGTGGGGSLSFFGGGGTESSLSTAGATSQYSTVALGAYADGGDYPANRLMLVGERGPELMLPRSSGTIVPNNALGGAPKITVNITNNTGSPVTSRTTVTQQDGETILGLVLDSARTDRGGFGSGMKSALGVT